MSSTNFLFNRVIPYTTTTLLSERSSNNKNSSSNNRAKNRRILPRDGAVVRALASHQCGLGSIPRLGVICGLTFVGYLLCTERFFSGYSGFFSSILFNDVKRCWLLEWANRKTLNNNDHNQAFWARETEHLQQTIVLTKTAGQQPGKPALYSVPGCNRGCNCGYGHEYVIERTISAQAHTQQCWKAAANGFHFIQHSRKQKECWMVVEAKLLNSFDLDIDSTSFQLRFNMFQHGWKGEGGRGSNESQHQHRRSAKSNGFWSRRHLSVDSIGWHVDIRPIWLAIETQPRLISPPTLVATPATFLNKPFSCWTGKRLGNAPLGRRKMTEFHVV